MSVSIERVVQNRKKQTWDTLIPGGIGVRAVSRHHSGGPWNNAGMLLEVPVFSKFLHATALLYPSQVSSPDLTLRQPATTCVPPRTYPQRLHAVPPLAPAASCRPGGFSFRSVNSSQHWNMHPASQTSGPRGCLRRGLRPPPANGRIRSACKPACSSLHKILL